MPATPPTRPRGPVKQNAVLRWVRRYLGYSRSEARGLALLLALVLLFALAPILLKPELPAYLPARDQQELNKLAATLKEHRISGGAYAARYPKREYKRFERGGARYPKVPQVALSPFDPNALSAEGWEARGVPHFVAGRIVKYRDMAGGFKAKAQIKKMYGLEASVYDRLAPFMQLPDEMPRRGARADYAAGSHDGKLPPFAANAEAASKYPRKPRNLQPFDLNTADTTQLMQIRGIGSGRAKWVVKYRSQLGGFVREDQLSEVFVLRDAPDLIDSLKKYTFVAPGFAPQLVAVNTASFDEMYEHPYIRKGLARIIVAYRKQHGPYKTADDLKGIPILKAEDLDRLRPYVKCE
jgi:competence protein ComEA